MEVVFGTCNSDRRVLDKRPYFTITHSTACQFKSDVNTRNGMLILQNWDGAFDSNYCYIAKYGYYYYVGEPTIETGGRMSIPITLDVLTTYSDGIKALNLTVNRNENAPNTYIKDSAYTYQANRQCETLLFNQTPFRANYGTDYVYVLSVLGGHVPS